MRFFPVLLLLSIASMMSETSAFAVVRMQEKTKIQLVDEYIETDSGAERISLAKLARSIDSSDPALVEQLQQLPVIDVPKPGERIRLGKHQVLFKIRTAGFDYHQIDLQGESVITVYGPGQKVTIEEMIEAIKEDILQDSGWTESELVLQVLSTPARHTWLPAADFEMMVERTGPMIHGSNRYEVQFFVNHVLVDKAVFLVKVLHERPVFVAARPIQRGEVIQAQDITSRMVMVDNEARDQQMVSNVQDIVGQRARIPIAKNEEVRTYSLETNYLLRRGDLVQVLVKNNGITMQTLGLAQTRGAVGDVIPVKAQGTGKLLKAKVLSRNLVELVSS
ncbi:MAG: flagellar basal body P-ring formation chaperone FlgA [bacterium]